MNNNECTCDIPNRANYYASAIVSRDVPGGTETEEVDGYFCEDHMPAIFDSESVRELFGIGVGDYIVEYDWTFLR